MKITFTADTHGHNYVLDQISDGDVFVHAGDFTGGKANRLLPSLISFSHRTSFLEFLDTVEKLPHKHKIIVPGNHDQIVQTELVWSRCQAKTRGIHLLIDKAITIDGVKFYGFPWTKLFCKWFFTLPDDFLKEAVSRIPTDTNVLISHGPALGLLDTNIDGLNCGCPHLRKKLDSGELTSLKYLACGHIHEDGGRKTKHDGVEILNVAVSHITIKYPLPPKDRCNNCKEMFEREGEEEEFLCSICIDELDCKYCGGPGCHMCAG